MVKVARRRFMFLIAVILISTVVLLPIEVAAAGTLDQQQTQVNHDVNLVNFGGATNFHAQTFTAGLTGSLTEVDLIIACQTGGLTGCASNGAITVEIHSGSPAGALLGSSSLVPTASNPPVWNGIPPIPSVFVAFTFSSPSVVAGNVYAVVITAAPNSPPGGTLYTLGDSSGDPYAGGQEYYNNNEAGWNAGGIEGYDLAFKTFVTPVAPVGGLVEPVNTLAVLAPWLAAIGVVGCIGIIAVIAKKRRS